MFGPVAAEVGLQLLLRPYSSALGEIAWYVVTASHVYTSVTLILSEVFKRCLEDLSQYCCWGNLPLLFVFQSRGITSFARRPQWSLSMAYILGSLWVFRKSWENNWWIKNMVRAFGALFNFLAKMQYVRFLQAITSEELNVSLAGCLTIAWSN